MLKRLLFLVAIVAAAVTASAQSDPVSRFVPKDQRNAISDVKITRDGDTATLAGWVGTAAQRDSVVRCLREECGMSSVNTDSLRVLELEVPSGKRWAQVKVAVASLRCEPRHAGEMATQAVMGMPMKVLELKGEWARVQLPDEYIAWVPESSIAYKTDVEFAAWRANRDRCIVTSMSASVMSAPYGDEPVSDLVLGCMLEVKERVGSWQRVVIPDGREGFVALRDVTSLATWASQTFDAPQIERTARKMLGAGYLWGGTSTKVTDCSGLVKVCYLANGIILHRDASQQAKTGEKIADWHDAQLGDLLFFGNSKTGRVTHVGIYLRDGMYIHCSGQVKINSLNEDDPLYLYSPLSISRIGGRVGTTGIVAARNHPWLF